MIDKVKENQCVQCGNCIQKCPVNAITFAKRKGMFLYPIIDYKKCVDCSMCEITCPVLNPLDRIEAIASYAVKNKDREILTKSSSGGLFSALAEVVITEGGIVYGAAFNNDFSVKHISINNIEDISLLRGSKYLRSEIGVCFAEIEQLLESSNTVLFTGCPCQCAALRAFLGRKDYKGILYLVDFVCHGMISESLFAEYIQYLEDRNRSGVAEFSFRNKTYGWVDSGPQVVFKNGKTKRWPLYEDLYMQGYFKGLCMRESCNTCIYKNFHSGSDLTMGDFWGAELIEPDFFDPMGVSLCCVQTDAGVQLLDKAKSLLNIKQVDISKLSQYNKGLFKPFSKGPNSNEFYLLAAERGNISALKQISKVSGIEQLKRYYRQLKRKIKYSKMR